MLAPVTHIHPLTLVRRTRMLPAAGRILVRPGQKVSATDVIADTRLATTHLVLDIGRGLGMPVEAAEQRITRKVGDEVSEGDVIAGPVGVIQRRVRSPKEGRIVAIGGGQVLLEMASAPFELLAGLNGIVADIIPERGVIIEVTGALVQGVWGNGRIDKGVLTVVGHGPEDAFTTSQLDVSMRGVVVLAGPCSQAESLHMAAEIPLRGVILPSLTAELVPVAQSLNLPVILTEGFGKFPMNRLAYQVLSTNDKREAIINATPTDHFSGSRPEVMIPLPAAGQPPPPREVDIFAPGQTVRIFRAPHASAVGTLVSLRQGQVTFPSGVHAPAAMVRLENGDQVLAPLVNMEVIE